MKQSVVILLFKKGDSQFGNLRPITLLNSDYKMFTKILANRLREVIAEVIYEHQVCAVPE